MKKILPIASLNILVLTIFLGITSCEIINPNEDIPFYLQIDSISFIDSTVIPARPVKSGVQNIRDAWVFVDGIYVGTFELPCKIPVYSDKSTNEVIVSPGIFISAQSSNRGIYPFFTEYKTTINTEKGKTSTVIPAVSYDPVAVKYPSEGAGQFPEQFEGVGTIFRTTINSDVDTIIRTDNPSLVFDGNYSMLMEMDATKDYLEFETEKAYSLPVNGRTIYLEVNYRANVLLNIGVNAIKNDGSGTIDQPVITMSPTNNEWRKLYLKLTEAVARNDNSKYRIYFRANHDSGNTSSQVLLDNFRLMYK